MPTNCCFSLLSFSFTFPRLILQFPVPHSQTTKSTEYPAYDTQMPECLLKPNWEAYE